MSTNVEERSGDLSIQNELSHPPQRDKLPAAPSTHRVPTRPAKRPPPPSQPNYQVSRQTNIRQQDAHGTNQKAEELGDVITQQPQPQPAVRPIAESFAESEASVVPDHKGEKQPIIQSKNKPTKKKKRIKEESERNCCCHCCQTLCYEVCTLHTQLL